jgi:hypothetical protein
MKTFVMHRCQQFWLIMAFFLSAFSVNAQAPVVFEEWAKSEGVQEFFYKNVTVTDGSNNVYVAGATLNSDGNYDLLISKFDRHGVHLWSDTVAGAGEGHDMAAAIAIDAEGDILVCGTISAGGSEGNNMLLVKYVPMDLNIGVIATIMLEMMMPLWHYVSMVTTIFTLPVEHTTPLHYLIC